MLHGTYTGRNHMKKKLSWQVFSNDDRHKVIEAVKNAISHSDGCMLHWHELSNKALILLGLYHEDFLPLLIIKDSFCLRRIIIKRMTSFYTQTYL